MQYFSIVIFSVVQAITEFVPISSSGHLVILHNILPQISINDLAFDVFLHAGTISSVIIFFAADIKKMIKAFYQSLIGHGLNEDGRLAWLIVLATVPAAVAGYFFGDLIEYRLRSIMVVAVMLILVGLFFLVVEKFAKQTDDLRNLNWRSSLAVGCSQALALIPGTSRSGITIASGMIFNLKREAALRFSFLLSIPIILGANIKKIIPMYGTITGSEAPVFMLGFLTSAFCGYFVIKYLIRFVKNNSLKVFAYYRFVLAAILLLVYYL